MRTPGETVVMTSQASVPFGVRLTLSLYVSPTSIEGTIVQLGGIAATPPGAALAGGLAGGGGPPATGFAGGVYAPCADAGKACPSKNAPQHNSPMPHLRLAPRDHRKSRESSRHSIGPQRLSATVAIIISEVPLHRHRLHLVQNDAGHFVRAQHRGDLADHGTRGALRLDDENHLPYISRQHGRLGARQHRRRVKNDDAIRIASRNFIGEACHSRAGK